LNINISKVFGLIDINQGHQSWQSQIFAYARLTGHSRWDNVVCQAEKEAWL